MRLRVRAYNVGSGDCILVSWDEADRMHHAWVDFGTHPFDKQAPSSTYSTVLADVLATTGGHIDLLAVTHRHEDHYGGFYSMRQAIKDSFQVDRVWEAWVDPTLDAQFKIASGTLAAMAGAGSGLGTGAIDALYQNNVAASGADAMKTVAAFAPAGSAFKVHRQSNLAAAAPPGWAQMQIDILGPEQDSSRYLVAMDTSLRARTALNADLDSWAGAEVTEALADAVAGADGEGAGDPGEVPDFLKLADFARLRRLLQGGGGADLLLAIDKTRNNTSIVTRWRWKDVTLLLPGDAQLQSWKIMRDNGTAFRSTLVKIGHHGSINASPAWSYQQVFPTSAASNAALLSTNPLTYHDVNPVPHDDVVHGFTNRMRYPKRFRRTDLVDWGAYVEVVFDRA